MAALMGIKRVLITKNSIKTLKQEELAIRLMVLKKQKKNQRIPARMKSIFYH